MATVVLDCLQLRTELTVSRRKLRVVHWCKRTDVLNT